VISKIDPVLVIQDSPYVQRQSIKAPLAASFHGRSRHCQSGLPTFRGIMMTRRARTDGFIEPSII
jgi:hypothetical protein